MIFMNIIFYILKITKIKNINTNLFYKYSIYFNNIL